MLKLTNHDQDKTVISSIEEPRKLVENLDRIKDYLNRDDVVITTIRQNDQVVRLDRLSNSLNRDVEVRLDDDEYHIRLRFRFKNVLTSVTALEWGKNQIKDVNDSDRWVEFGIHNFPPATETGEANSPMDSTDNMGLIEINKFGYIDGEGLDYVDRYVIHYEKTDVN